MQTLVPESNTRGIAKAGKTKLPKPKTSTGNQRMGGEGIEPPTFAL